MLSEKKTSTETFEDNISTNVSTNDNDGLGDFVCSIVDNGISGKIPEEPSRMEDPKKLLLLMYGTSNGRFQLLPENFTFPTLTLASLVTAWYCGNRSKGIPPYRVLKGCDVLDVKSGKQKLTNMKGLMRCVEKGARIVNLPHLVKRNMAERDAITLYNSVKHLFQFPATNNKKRRYETMSWKSYYNLLCERKWRLYGETEGKEQEQARERTVEQAKESRGNQSRLVPDKVGKQLRTTKCTSRSGSTSNTKKKRKTRRDEVNNDFASAFASVPIVGKERPREGMENTCSLGKECKHMHIKGTMKCHGDGCGRRIHHLCAITLNLLDKENELNVYCSAKCMPDD